MSIRFFIIGLVLLGLSLVSNSASAQSCDCEQIVCEPCEQAVDYDFYTAPCDGGRRVKSCKKYQCVEVKNYKQCMAQFQKKLPRQSQQIVAQNKKSSFRPIGKVLLVRGKVQLKRSDGDHRIRRGTRLLEGDLVVTGKNSKAVVLLSKNTRALSLRGPSSQSKENKLVLSQNSRLTFVRHDAGEEEKKTLLMLWYGRLRSQVDGYDRSKGASFKVKAGAAVAGVRGTDFVTEFYPGDEEWKFTVKTIRGNVKLSGLSQVEGRFVKKGEKASFIVPKPLKKSGFTEAEYKEMAEKGYLTPVYKMSSDEINKLEWETSSTNQVKRSLASEQAQKKNEKICMNPPGEFKQCLWTCEGAPASSGGKGCSTELKSVNCIRRVCNANGEWAEPTPFNDPTQVLCSVVGPKIAPCDP